MYPVERLAVADPIRLAATGRALAAGLVPETSARLIAIRLRDHDGALATSVESAVLPYAQALTHRTLERVLSREIAVQRAALGVLDCEVARSERRVTRPRPGEFGSASLQVVGPAEDIQVLHLALTALAEATRTAARAPRDPDAESALLQVEGLDAYRFDALVSLACAALADSTLPTHHGRRPSICATVPVAVLLGLSQAPAELEGHGPISAAAARRLAADYGTSTYRPPRQLSDLIIARDRTCAFPGCRQSARLTQLDHVVPFPRGSTSAANMGPACQLATGDHMTNRQCSDSIA